MNAHKKTLSALTALTLALSLAACSGGKAPTATPAGTTTPPAVTAPAATSAPSGETRTQYPLTYATYNYAKEPIEVTLEKAPERVYAQGQDNIEILLALGLGDKIVGCSGLDGEVRPDLADAFAKVNYYDSFPGKESVMGLEPDFVAGWYSTFEEKRLGDVDFWNGRNVGTYMALNSACRGRSSENPQTVNEEMRDILTLGEIFDVQDRAGALVQEIQDELTSITDYLAGKDRLSAAVLEDEGGSYRVYGEDTLGGNVAINGGAELAVGKHGDNANISAEDLIAANPDAIFMVWYEGFSVGETDYASDQVVTLITENPAFASLTAVKTGRVYPINLSGIYCSGMRTLDGVLDFAQNLYPELYQ